MSEPDEEKVKLQENNNDEKGIYDKVQYAPFELPSFMSGCFTFGALNFILIIAIGVFLFDNSDNKIKQMMEKMPDYSPLIIIFIINFFFVRHFFKTGRKSFAYGIITGSLFFLLISGSCFK